VRRPSRPLQFPALIRRRRARRRLAPDGSGSAITLRKGTFIRNHPQFTRIAISTVSSCAGLRMTTAIWLRFQHQHPHASVLSPVSAPNPSPLARHQRKAARLSCEHLGFGAGQLGLHMLLSKPCRRSARLRVTPAPSALELQRRLWVALVLFVKKSIDIVLKATPSCKQHDSSSECFLTAMASEVLEPYTSTTQPRPQPLQ
jgi:hypothetical protein